MEPSDDDVPLSKLQNEIVSKEDAESIWYELSQKDMKKIKNKCDMTKQERKERRRLKRERRLAKMLRNSNLEISKKKVILNKKKRYEYKNGKKVFRRSDSESSDFEKYTYFDESKTKRKLKLDPDLSVENLQRQIGEIKMENLCLVREHSRINKIKLEERMKLRVEMKRLKADILDLQLQGYLRTHLIPETGNTKSLIEVLKKYQADVENSQISVQSNEGLKDRLKNFAFTKTDFWKEFNNIEFNTDSIKPNPYWVGDLNTITPETDVYFVPDDRLRSLILSQDKGDTLHSKSDFLLSENSSAKCEVFTKQDNEDTDNIENDNISNHSYDTEIPSPINNDCDKGWNTTDTKFRENGEKLKSIENEKQIHKNSNFSDERKHLNNNADGVCGWGKIEAEGFDKDAENGRFMRRDDAKNGIAVKLEEEVGVCTECGYDSSWVSFISRHREAYQKGIKLTPCHTCNIRFLKSGHFDGRHRLKRPHPKSFRARAFMCEECGQRCTSRSGLQQHRLKHGEARHACPHCSYTCHRKGYLKKHVETHNRKPHTKPASEETAETPQELSQYSCDICDHISDSLQSFKKHQSDHSIKKTFACTSCPYITNKSSTLTQHIRTHTRQKPFECTYCDYKSSCKSYLKSHIRYHTGSRPFKCDQCSYQCVTSTRLKIHKKTHSGERDYACTVCEYRGTTNYNLKMHLRLHNKEKVVKCSVCGFECCTNSKLMTHMKSHAIESFTYSLNQNFVGNDTV